MAELILSWPSWLRLIIALVLYCGITIAILAVFRDRIIALGNSDPWPYFPRTRDEKREADETSPTPVPPDSVYLGQRVSQWVGMAFVFLLAFTVSNLWSNAEQARMLTKNETFTFEAAYAAANQLTPGEGREEVVQGLDKYADAVVAQWPLLRAADAGAEAQAQRTASLELGLAMRAADLKGASKDDEWAGLTSDVEDLINDGVDRLDVIPSVQVPAMLSLLFLLGLITLAVTAAYQSATLGSNLFLMGLMAAVVGLLTYFVIEISNPFLGGVGVVPGIG